MKVQEQVKNNFFKEMVRKLKEIAKLKASEIMLLESICFKLEEIDNNQQLEGSNNRIINTEYAFSLNSSKFVNIFKSNSEYVDPIKCYGLGVLNTSKLIDLIREFTNGDEIKGHELNVIAEKIIYHILEKSNIDCRKYNFIGPVVSDYYCNSEFSYKFEDVTLDPKSKESQKDIIMYMLNNYKYINVDMDELDTFLVYRTINDCELLRVSILGYLHYVSEFDQSYSDCDMFISNNFKISFNDSLFMLFLDIWTSAYGTTDNIFEIFKREIIKNYDLREVFFDSINILLNKPNTEGFEEVENLIRGFYILITR